MTRATVIESLRQFVARFVGSKEGNVVVTFALALLPLMGFVGAAVDYSRANRARTAMQTALDSAALMLAKDASSLSSSQLAQKANDYFFALYTDPEASAVTVSTTYSTNTAAGSSVVLSSSGTVPTDFLGMAGISTIPISASATATWGNTRLRVALALDNTGSMSSAGKMTALKSATTNLITQLSALSATNGDVYISIVPFVKDVNVGNSNKSQSWIDWTDWDDANGSCSSSKYKSKNSCEKKGKVWTPDSHNTWNGCVMDRDQNYDTLVTPPTVANTSTLFPAEQYSSCPGAAIMPLTYDWTALKNLVNSMSPSGTTNQPIGLVWAWQSLMQTSPLNAPAKDANYQYSDIIILLSDGLNTADRWYGSASQIDARQTILCNNIKASGVTVYSIQVNTDGDPTSNVLKNCASTSDKFFMLTSANQIVTTFDAISTAISKLRLSK